MSTKSELMAYHNQIADARKRLTEATAVHNDKARDNYQREIEFQFLNAGNWMDNHYDELLRALLCAEIVLPEGKP